MSRQQDQDASADQLGRGLTMIDTFTADIPRVTAGFLIAAPRPTLVECGPSLSIHHVVDQLQARGLGPDDLAYLVVSHIHLDHAGGAGEMLSAFPGARLVVSEVGARHLVEPGRLNASSRRVYGELMDTVYGECTPIDEDRVIAVADGDVLDMGGGRQLDLFYTPGHAKHHIAALDSETGALFVGDSVGVKMDGMQVIRPATPPPDFHLEQSFATLDRYLELAPETVYLAHYGPVDPPGEALFEAKNRLQAWADAAETAWQEHNDTHHIADTLMARFADEVKTSGPDQERALALLSGYESNAMGLQRYFTKRAESAS